MLFGFTRLELSGVAFRRETIDTVCPPLGFQFLFPNAGHIEHFLAGLAAHRRFPNKKGCKTADQAGRHVAPPQWRSNKNHPPNLRDRKSTRLNSSHLGTSYAVFCLKTKTSTPIP